MGRRTIAFIIIAMMTDPASAQKNNAELAVTSAKSVARFTAVKHFCPQRIPTDAAYADNLADAFAYMGRQAAPNEWSKLLMTEARRRRSEVAITGEQEWCENQRNRMEEIRDFKLFPRGR